MYSLMELTGKEAFLLQQTKKKNLPFGRFFDSNRVTGVFLSKQQQQ